MLASKNAKTKLLNTVGREKFKNLEAKGLPNCPPKPSGGPKATDIANAICRVLCERADVKEPQLPEITTIEGRVREWLKNSAK